MKIFKKSSVTYSIVLLVIVFSATSCNSNDKEDIQTVDNYNETIAILEENYQESNMSINANEESNNKQRSIILNQQGEEFFQRQEYKDALKLFRESFSLDDNYYIAHYNYALTLAILYNENNALFPGAETDITNHLKKTVDIKPDYIEEIEQQKEFDCVRDTYGYMLILGYSPYSTKDVEYILQNLSWYTKGSYTPFANANFKDDYTANFYFHSSDNSTYHVQGIYSVDGNQITIILDEKMLRKRTYEDIMYNKTEYEEQTTIKGELYEDGRIIIDIFDYYFTSTFSMDPI